jgi:protein SCO1/2
MGALSLRGGLGGLRSFFSGGRFAAFMLVALATFYALLLAVVLWPGGDSGFAGFAAGFRRWCLTSGDDGRVSPLAVATLFGEPLLLGAVVLGLWWQPLRAELAEPRRLVGSGIAAVSLVALVLGVLALQIGPAGGAALAFPGARIRTAVPAPEFSLIDHEGHTVAPADLRGRVVVITAVYSSCGATCPMIVAQIRKVMGTLDDAVAKDVVVLAITMDPEQDTRERLAEVANAQSMSAPRYHFLTGAPEVVNRALDAYGVERRQNPDTGMIDHTNLFVVVDRQGKIAYRFTLGDQQAEWLGVAIRQLVRE